MADQRGLLLAVAAPVLEFQSPLARDSPGLWRGNLLPEALQLQGSESKAEMVSYNGPNSLDQAEGALIVTDTSLKPRGALLSSLAFVFAVDRTAKMQYRYQFVRL